jgi:catechol 2,3-dioxygenase-like lactoylglutathione lyase family enzyme
MIELHHINLPSHDIEGTEAFYRDVVGLTDLEGGEGDAMKQRLTENVTISTSFLGLGKGPDAIQLHLSDVDFNLHTRSGQGVNPVTPAGHVALRTDDIDGLKRRLEAAGWDYSDYGSSQVHDWQQIFFIDPAGHVIEVHQSIEG